MCSQRNEVGRESSGHKEAKLYLWNIPDFPWMEEVHTYFICLEFPPQNKAK